MPKITKAMWDQVDSLRDAAAGGLPRNLAQFIHMSLWRFERLERVYSSDDMQRYLDTLTDLIDTKVHSE